jgi:hypothetical protein
MGRSEIIRANLILVNTSERIMLNIPKNLLMEAN